MKSKKIKLQLNKETIANLNELEMSSINGGEAARTYSKFPCTLLISNCIRCCPKFDAAGNQIDDTMNGIDDGENLTNAIDLINQHIIEQDTHKSFIIQ